MRLPVSIAAWQIQCCLPPPAVGDEVAWPLMLREDESVDPAALLTVTGQARRLPTWGGATLGSQPSLLTLDSAVLYWEPTTRLAGEQRVSGHLTVEDHGSAPDDLPLTHGRIVGIRIVGTLYEEVPPGAGSWQPARPRDVVHVHVPAVMRWFGEPRTPVAPARLFDSVLVDLEV